MLRKIGLITLELIKMILELKYIKAFIKLFLRGMLRVVLLGRLLFPFLGNESPRYMINNYQDAIAICRAYRNPDMFITFTCNVNWQEIQRELREERFYRQEDKPNIITRIFYAKLADMWLCQIRKIIWLYNCKFFHMPFFMCFKNFPCFLFPNLVV